MNVKQKIFDLRKEMGDFNNQVDYRIQYCYLFNISQNLYEIEMLAEYIGDRKFNYYVELGGGNGGSLWFYSNLFCTPSATIICIEPKRMVALLHVINKLEEKGFKVRHTQSWSYVKQIYESINDTIDLLHIDASHLYEDVRQDFNMYYPKVAKGGIILLHDIIAHKGTKYFANDIEEKYNMKRIIDPEHSLGIGVIEKK